MAGAILFVNVPKKEYEEQLRDKEKLSKMGLEKEKIENSRKLVNELKITKRFSSRKSSIESYAQDDHNNVIISKCQSIDCLNNQKEGEICRSKSEQNIGDAESSITAEGSSNMKSSWEEIKQVIKRKRNKVRITRLPRGVDIAAAFQWDTPLEDILHEIISRLELNNATWNSTRDNKYWQVTFSLESGHLCEELLQVLKAVGIGSRYQSVLGVTPCALYYKCDDKQSLSERESELYQSESNSAWSRISSSVRWRNNLAQTLHDVRGEATLTFDWLFLLVVAAFVAAIGLVENSTVILVASMLISPLMGPITAGTLGTAVKDRTLQRMGLMHEMLGLFLALVIGFVFGLTICAVDERYGVNSWPTDEMISRCEIRSLWVGILVAVPSGAGVALAVLGEYTASLVGVAISASLLPPAVNAGLFWAMALVQLIHMDEKNSWPVASTSLYSDNPIEELSLLGTVSLCLTLVNIACIFITGVVVYKVKEVCPFERRDISWWKFNKNESKQEKYQPNISNTGPCSIYSKFNNSTENNHENDNKTVAQDFLSNTVTYRRPNAGRIRAQNIEAYCLNKVENNDIFLPLQSNVCKDTTVEATHSKHNQAENFEYDYHSAARFHPTIVPSSNLTLESTNIGPILGSRTYHV